MPTPEIAQRVRIYLSQDDAWEGRPRYIAILDHLRTIGATGATVLQGLAGFGPGQRVRPGKIERPDQHQSVVVEWIDRRDRVARLLPLIDELLTQSLVTIEDVPIYRAVLRDSGPLKGDRTVGDVMRKPAPTAASEANVSTALALLIKHRLSALPISDEEGRLVGLLSEQELAWRLGLRLPLNLFGHLTPDERDTLVAPRINRPLREVMSAEPRSVSIFTSLPQALVTMVEWGYPHVPVVDREGKVVGIIGQEDVLRVVVEQEPPASSNVTAAEPPTTVAMVMQTLTPQLSLGQTLGLALEQLVAKPSRRILITDSAGTLRGTLDLGGVLPQLNTEVRAALMAALHTPQPGAFKLSPQQPIDAFVQPDPPTVRPEMPISQAAQRLLELGHESLPVVDSEQRLLGIIARGGLVRAILQQSE
ncbi:CBS domain-containing protein [Oscillochloris trichoides DG-6]|uniref:CBS domain-containing protein n=1 Tax=Oscillochloris trichoides DG-6 TaxID=765420 RepID=E1IIL1_9CHLR|nr:DUF190 domain-containing protein [Oscillochloris trichoides]EFO78961.1 CBS domain-containing protein [Oscillochloris trichoides DG-6]